VGCLLGSLHVLRLLIGWTLGILTVLVVLGVHCILLAFHALVVISATFELIVVVILGLVLRRCLSPVIAAAHVGGLHVLDSSLRRRVLLGPHRLIGTILLVLQLDLALLLGLLLVQLLTLEAHLLAVAQVRELGHAPIADVHLVLGHIVHGLGFYLGVAALPYRVRVVLGVWLVPRWRPILVLWTHTLAVWRLVRPVALLLRLLQVLPPILLKIVQVLFLVFVPLLVCHVLD
jgi:hypothetical protein